jgi:hypothetical protein
LQSIFVEVCCDCCVTLATRQRALAQLKRCGCRNLICEINCDV